MTRQESMYNQVGGFDLREDKIPPHIYKAIMHQSDIIFCDFSWSFCDVCPYAYIHYNIPFHGSFITSGIYF